MGNSYRIAQFTASTSSSTQDVTSSGWGLTPVCAIAFVSKATGVGLGNGSYGASLSIGASDDTTDKAASCHDEHLQGKTDTHRINHSSGSVIVLDDNNGIDGVGTMSMISDGVRITWSTQPTIAAVGFVAMFGGDLTATVQWCSVSTSSSTNYTHDTGTSADLVFLFSTCNGVEGTGVAAHAGISWGVWTNDTGGMRCLRWGEADNQAESDDFAWFSTTAAYRNIYQSTTYGQGTVSTHANGFTLTANSQGSVDTFALSIKWTGSTVPNVQVGSFQTPTSIGTQSQSGMGFQPALVMGGLSTITAALSLRHSDEADTFSAFAFTGPTDAQSLLYSGDYGNTLSWGRSFVCDESGDDTFSAPINGYNPINGYLAANVDSMDSGGFTLDWQNVNGSSQFYSWYLAIEEVADTGKTGTGALTLPIPTMSGTGKRGHEGSGTPSLPLPTMSATGKLTYKGSGAPSLPLPTMSASGKVGYQGTSATTLPVPTMSATGVASHVGSSAMTLPMPTMTGTGTTGEAIEGTGALTLPLPTLSGTGKLGHFGSSAATLPIPTMSGTGTASHHGTSAATLPLPTLSGTGKLTYRGSGALTLLLPTMSATASAVHHGTAAMTLPLPTMSATGIGGLAKVGTSAMDLPLPTLTGSGKLGHLGTGSLVLPVPTMSATGALTYLGSGTPVLPVPTMSAAGKLGHSATSAMDLLVPTMDGTGVASVGAAIGTGTLTLLVPTMSASAELGHSGTSAMTLPVPTASGMACALNDARLYGYILDVRNLCYVIIARMRGGF